MATVPLTLPHRRYEIQIEPGLLSRLGERVRQVAPHHLCALLADASVFNRYGRTARESLAAAGYQVTADAIAAGEERKSLATAGELFELLIKAKMERKSPVIALGGGVMGDLVGFAASTYLRGVPFVQCPTTLLAMVDASVGGKVGVNLPQGKNLVGSFYQPMLVAIDTDSLATLPPRELRCGLAECVKHGVIRDAKLFTWIENHLDAIQKLDSATMVELVRWNVQIKANVVMADEKETGERAHLNFGHTFGHAVEATSGYGKYHHGEAVALGMVAAARLAVDLGRCKGDVLDRLVGLLERIGLPTRAPDLAPTGQLLETMRIDKKVKGGQIRLILPDGMGAVSMVGDVGDSAIAAAWETVRGNC